MWSNVFEFCVLATSGLINLSGRGKTGFSIPGIVEARCLLHSRQKELIRVIGGLSVKSIALGRRLPQDMDLDDRRVRTCDFAEPD